MHPPRSDGDGREHPRRLKAGGLVIPPLDPYYLARYAHFLGVFLFLLAHGASMSMAFQLKKETNRDRIGALLDSSRASFKGLYLAFILLLGSAIAIAVMGEFWRAAWFWVALVTFFAMSGVMTPFGTIPLAKLRIGLGLKLPPPGKPRADMKTEISDEEIRDVIDKLNPWMLSAVGFGGIAVLAFLMMFKPF